MAGMHFEVSHYLPIACQRLFNFQGRSAGESPARLFVVACVGPLEGHSIIYLLPDGSGFDDPWRAGGLVLSTENFLCFLRLIDNVTRGETFFAFVLKKKKDLCFA